MYICRTMPRLCVIIVTYNSAQWVDRCLGSLRGSTVKADVTVIDNASSDNTVQLIREGYPEARIIESKTNLGFGAANNIGLREALQADYDFVYLLNADAWVEPDCLERLLDSFKPGFGVLSPVQKDAQGELDRNFAKKTSKFLNQSEEDIVEVPFVMAAHWMVSREALRTVGGFSPAFTQYGEDDNWIHRLHFHGLKAGVVPSACAVHDRAARTESKESRMRLKCISAVVKLSDPGRCLTWMMLREPLELIGMSLKNASTAPLKFLPAFLGRYPEIIAHRKNSKKKSAFLV